MKTIGLIGGMSWESTLDYYKIINEQVQKKLGGLHSAKILMYSVDFAEIEALIDQSKWEEAGHIIVDVAKKLESVGADLIVICTNTMHKIANQVENSIHIPLLHIVDPTAESVRKKDIKKVGLMGTKPTMEESFYKDRLKEKFDIEAVIPTDDERQIIHDIIFQELCKGIISDKSKRKFQEIITNLEKKGAQGIILGCTELHTLVKQTDISIPLFDTARIHAEAAADLALR